MEALIKELVKDKKVLILGYGREGQSSCALVKKVGGYSEIAIADMKKIDLPDGTPVYSGEGYLDVLEDYDVVFKSPGIVLPKARSEYSCQITSQIELFLKRHGRRTIGITGTKGKSTVSSLTHHVLSENGVASILAGNIGKPVFDILPEIAPETVVVLELSCHQLEYCDYSPSIAVLLNLYEDHLDHYGTFEKYVEAKKNIYKNQYPLDVLYYNGQLDFVKDEARSIKITIDPFSLPFASFISVGVRSLMGRHNLYNCAVAFRIASLFGIGNEEFIKSLRTFIPLRHRLEFIGEKNGVSYYDDSISTTVESTISAIESVENVSTVILGGMDRGIHYAKLIGCLKEKKLPYVICMYESGRRIYDMLGEENIAESEIYYCSDLYEAAEKAMEVAPEGSACVLSPAAASYGDFKNFAERGEVFKSLVFGN